MRGLYGREYCYYNIEENRHDGGPLGEAELYISPYDAVDVYVLYE